MGQSIHCGYLILVLIAELIELAAQDHEQKEGMMELGTARGTVQGMGSLVVGSTSEGCYERNMEKTTLFCIIPGLGMGSTSNQKARMSERSH